MKLLRLSVIVLVAFAGVARAQVTSPLQQRANEVVAQFRPAPGDYDKLFAPGLLASPSRAIQHNLPRLLLKARTLHASKAGYATGRKRRPLRLHIRARL